MHLKKKVNLLTAIVCFILCFTITLQYKSVTRNKSMNTSQLQRNEELQTQLINAKNILIYTVGILPTPFILKKI